MRQIEFDDSTFPFVYSYNTIMHLSKKDTIQAMREIERILIPSGLCYVNFMSEDSDIGDRGEKIGEGEYLLPIGNNETVFHSFHADDEADTYFTNFELIHKDKRLIYRYNNKKLQFVIGEINYIAKKK